MAFREPTVAFDPTPKLTTAINLTGQRFNRLLVVSIYGKNKWRNIMWLCQCSCSNFLVVSGGRLINKNTQSCGCLARELVKSRFITHGQTINRIYTSEYCAFLAAKSRCTNDTTVHWHRYGGRGIEFRFDSFDAFLKELGKRPSKQHTLDRIDNNGHYEIGNVRWATQSEQSRNTSVTIRLTIDGITKSASEWGEAHNIKSSTIKSRLLRGWSPTSAVTTPLMNSRWHPY